MEASVGKKILKNTLRWFSRIKRTKNVTTMQGRFKIDTEYIVETFFFHASCLISVVSTISFIGESIHGKRKNPFGCDS